MMLLKYILIEEITTQYRAAKAGHLLISLSAFVARGRASVQLTNPLEPSLSNRVILPIALANFPFHLFCPLTKALNCGPTFAYTASFASDGKTTMPFVGLGVSE